ncbi:MAG: histidine phosphotransferase family protein [Paracoccaceae bacterium]|nr:histidine phosphotransferase family protein [Paracoccaceae bacterium]
MATTSETLAELIASRICHDLISPVGAIGNGIELLELAGQAESLEFSLLSESTAMATGKIRLFRVAFGHASPGQVMTHREIRQIADSLSSEGRLRLNVEAVGDMLRQEAKLLFLLVMCVESAFPRGGDVTVHRSSDGWELVASGPKPALDDALWAALKEGGADFSVQPSTIQFHLAATGAKALQRKIVMTPGPDRLVLRF